MAKVIFEFTWLESSDGCNGRREVLEAKACLADVSPEGESGPHDLLANNVLVMATEIIKKAKGEMLFAMEKVGMEAECDLVPRPVNAVKH
ncbi:hypothetical protein [Cronobacter sakazakii]|uniref:hypothetical protein n=1 Tax=Cronobacter sakazakii TaxID=28141 RepID=UPI000CF03719|nr:hypothetical protein [Cronobacter sakazakii]PPX99570.1 hypothetical protein C3D66_22305 [Cronobacter sakazakii]